MGVGTDDFVFGFSKGGNFVYVEWRALRERPVKSGCDGGRVWVCVPLCCVLLSNCAE